MNQPENPDSPTVLLRRLHHWRMAFFGLIILIAGLTTGAAVTFLVLHGAAPRPPVSPERSYEVMLERIMPRLHLSPEQARLAGPVLRHRMQRLEEIREQGRVQITAELQTMDQEMSDILDGAQQQRWRDLLRSVPGPFPRGPGPKGPFGPWGGGPGRFRKSTKIPAPAPNEPLPPD
ncbi:MAG: hypothetical protein MUC88_08280 [Planctomycetes bacterium]|nr:hypothetical protein [Planctomycetota bacterium]